MVDVERVHIELPDECRIVVALHPVVPVPDGPPRSWISCCREGCGRDCWLGGLDLAEVQAGNVVPMCLLCAARIVPVGVELLPGDRITLAKPLVRESVRREREARSLARRPYARRRAG